MTNETHDEADPAPNTDSGDASDARPSFRSALRGLKRAASEVAETSVEEARKLAETARPEVERRARQAKAAAEAARPRIEQKARDATEYVREHQEEIARASKRGAEVAASTAARAVTPGPLRPALDAMQRELRAPPDPKEAGKDATSEADTPIERDTTTEATDDNRP